VMGEGKSSPGGLSVLELPSQAEHAGASQSQPQVVTLVRLAGANTECPKQVHLGGGAPRTLHLGRHEDNQIVLSGRVFSKCHMQVSLRTFRRSPDTPEMEAAFLKDQSSNGTLINGLQGTKPWHWLQHGDRIGFRDRRGGSAIGHIDFFEVQYSSRQTVPREAFESESDPEDQQPLAAAKKKVQKSPPPEPEVPSPPVEQPVDPAVDAPAVDAAAQAKGPWRIPRCALTFGAEIKGAVLDVFYEEEKQTFRVRVDKFIKDDGFHHVDSAGLSDWDGDSFDDTLNMSAMYAQGFIKFVDETTLARIRGAEAAAALKEAQAQPRKRLRSAAPKTD